jgi:hypothetical protein
MDHDNAVAFGYMIDTVYQQRYKASGGAHPKTDLVSAGIRLKKNYATPVLTPSPAQRVAIYRTVERARVVLREKYGLDLTPAQIQAAVWYPEQNKWGKAENSITYLDEQMAKVAADDAAAVAAGGQPSGLVSVAGKQWKIVGGPDKGDIVPTAAMEVATPIVGVDPNKLNTTDRKRLAKGIADGATQWYNGQPVKEVTKYKWNDPWVQEFLAFEEADNAKYYEAAGLGSDVRYPAQLGDVLGELAARYRAFDIRRYLTLAGRGVRFTGPGRQGRRPLGASKLPRVYAGRGYHGGGEQLNVGVPDGSMRLHTGDVIVPVQEFTASKKYDALVNATRHNERVDPVGSTEDGTPNDRAPRAAFVPFVEVSQADQAAFIKAMEYAVAVDIGPYGPNGEPAYGLKHITNPDNRASWVARQLGVIMVTPKYIQPDTRLFLAHDGRAGFAVTGDYIHAVFTAPDAGIRGYAQSAIALAIDVGGRRLDCFDTFIAHAYSGAGFRAVSRLPFSDSDAPAGWFPHEVEFEGRTGRGGASGSHVAKHHKKHNGRPGRTLARPDHIPLDDSREARRHSGLRVTRDSDRGRGR